MEFRLDDELVSIFVGDSPNSVPVSGVLEGDVASGSKPYGTLIARLRFLSEPFFLISPVRIAGERSISLFLSSD